MTDYKIYNLESFKFGVSRLTGVLLILLYLFFFVQPTLGSDALKRELVENTSAIESNVFSDYSELEIMRMLTLTTLQSMSGEEVNSSTAAWVHLVWAIIKDFEEMNELTKSSLVSEHVKGMEIASELEKKINQLNTLDKNLSFFPELALQRFYAKEGEYFEDVARNEKVTKLRIEYMKKSKIGYQKSGELSKASRMDFEIRLLENIYLKDMKIAKKYIEKAKFLLQNAKHNSEVKEKKSLPIPIIPSRGEILLLYSFRDIINAGKLYKNAQAIYEKHKDEELNKIQYLGRDIHTLYYTFLIKIILSIIKYLTLILIIMIIIFSRIKKWKEDVQDTNLGRELIYLHNALQI